MVRPGAIQARTAWVPVGDGLEREFVVTLPLRTVSEMNARGNWQVTHRRRKLHRSVAGWTVAGALRVDAICGPWEVVLTRFSVGKGLDPHDGLPSAFKGIVDGIADALEIDDADPQVTWTYRQAKGPPGVEIRIRRRG